MEVGTRDLNPDPVFQIQVLQTEVTNGLSIATRPVATLLVAHKDVVLPRSETTQLVPQYYTTYYYRRRQHVYHTSLLRQ